MAQRSTSGLLGWIALATVLVLVATWIRDARDADRPETPHAAPVAVPAPNPVNVLVMTLDSLRADRLGSYGRAGDPSPNLDAFARDAVRFENAFSTTSFTPPAHASLLTSRYVGEHGLLTWNELPPEELSLAEILTAHGFRTGASVNLGLLSKQGLGQGFAWQREKLRHGSVLVADALEFLRAGDGRPWFLWLHFYDVHRPYRKVTGSGDRRAEHVRPSVGDVNEDYNLTPEDVEERGFDESDLRFVAERYDVGVADMDEILAPLLAELSTPARRADTLVIVTADHGESLLDHREHLFTHDPFLLSVVTRVPLLVRYPHLREAGTVRGDLVSLIDVAPTVLAEAGIARPESFRGESLRGSEAARLAARDAIFHEAWGWTEQKALRTRDRLVIHDVEEDETRVFAIDTDPAEQSPVEADDAPGAEVLVARLEEFAESSAEARAPELSPELQEQLRALGYAEE